MAKAKKTDNTAEIGFEEQIWKAADKLRGNLDASEYKNVVLGLIFLKYISDKFEQRYQELVEEGEGFEEDRDEYTYQNIFFVPQEARWETIAAAAHTPEIGKVIDNAMRMIKAIVAVPEVGEVYKGKVRSIMPYGAFVEFLPGKDGLLHISEIDWKRLETVEEAGIKEGDEIDVKLLDIDPKTGKFKLSRKVLLPRPERQERPEKK